MVSSTALAQLFRPDLSMELCGWDEFSVESASYLVDQASADLASRRVDNEEKLKTLRHAAGCSWNKKVMRAAGSREFSAILERAATNPRAKGLAKAREMRLRRTWPASAERSIEGPHKWWNPIATAGLSGWTSGEAWDKLWAEPSELLIVAPSDLAELRAEQLHIVSDSEEPNRLLRQLWTAVKGFGQRQRLERAGETVYLRS